MIRQKFTHMKSILGKYIHFYFVMVIIISVLSISSLTVNATQSKSENYNTSYSLGSNKVENLIIVAQAQLGRTKTQLGYTEAWCADFVSDCAKLAGLSDIIPANGYCGTLYTNIINSGGYEVSSPQRGDIVFYYCKATSCPNNGAPWVHVGIMVDSVNSIEGNYGGKVSLVSGSYTDANGHTLASGTITRKFVRPNYINYTTPPINVVADLEKSNFATGDQVTFYYGAENYTGVFIQIYYNDELAINNVVYDKIGYSFVDLNTPGNYKYVVKAFNEYGVTFSTPYYFTVQDSNNKPQNVELNLDKSQYEIGEVVKYTYSAGYTTGYMLSVYKDGNIYEVVNLEPYSTYSKKYTEPGNYEAYIVAKNSIGETFSNFGIANKFQVIESPPYNVVADLEKSNFATGAQVTFYYGAENYTGVFIQIYYNNELAINNVVYDKIGYSFVDLNTPGNYKYVVKAFNEYGVTFSTPYYFTVQDSNNKPQNVELNLDKSQYEIGEVVKYTYSAGYTTGYMLSVYKDGNIYEVVNLEPYSTYSKKYTEPGNYEAYIVAKNSMGETFSNSGVANKFTIILDINASGINDQVDAAMLLRHLSGIEPLTDDQYSRADIDGNGEVNMFDVIAILKNDN